MLQVTFLYFTMLQVICTAVPVRCLYNPASLTCGLTAPLLPSLRSSPGTLQHTPLSRPPPSTALTSPSSAGSLRRLRRPEARARCCPAPPSPPCRSCWGWRARSSLLTRPLRLDRRTRNIGVRGEAGRDSPAHHHNRTNTRSACHAGSRCHSVSRCHTLCHPLCVTLRDSVGGSLQPCSIGCCPAGPPGELPGPLSAACTTAATSLSRPHHPMATERHERPGRRSPSQPRPNPLGISETVPPFLRRSCPWVAVCGLLGSAQLVGPRQAAGANRSEEAGAAGHYLPGRTTCPRREDDLSGGGDTGGGGQAKGQFVGYRDRRKT